MTTDRRQHKESRDNYIDKMKMMMELRRAIETLKKNNAKKIDSLRSKNARFEIEVGKEREHTSIGRHQTQRSN